MTSGRWHRRCRQCEASLDTVARGRANRIPRTGIVRTHGRKTLHPRQATRRCAEVSDHPRDRTDCKRGVAALGAGRHVRRSSRWSWPVAAASSFSATRIASGAGAAMSAAMPTCLVHHSKPILAARIAAAPTLRLLCVPVPVPRPDPESPLHEGANPAPHSMAAVAFFFLPAHAERTSDGRESLHRTHADPQTGSTLTQIA